LLVGSPSPTDGDPGSPAGMTIVEGLNSSALCRFTFALLPSALLPSAFCLPKKK